MDGWGDEGDEFAEDDEDGTAEFGSGDGQGCYEECGECSSCIAVASDAVGESANMIADTMEAFGCDAWEAAEVLADVSGPGLTVGGIE